MSFILSPHCRNNSILLKTEGERLREGGHGKERVGPAVHTSSDGDTGSPVLIVLQWSGVLSCLSCTDSPACTGSPVLVVLYCMPSSACPCSPILHAFSACPVLLVPFLQSCFSSCFRAFLSQLSCPSGPVLTVLYLVSCFACLVPTRLS